MIRKTELTEEERRAAAAVMGSARTEAKIAASMNNLARRTPDQLGGKPALPLSEIKCTCEAGDSLEGHRWDCPRGQAIKRRKKAGKL